MSFRTVVIENKCKCSYSCGYLVATTVDSVRRIHISEIGCMVVESTNVYLSTYLIAELSKARVPMILCDEKHDPVAISLPLHGSHNCSGRVQKQLTWTEPRKKRVWQRIVQHKLRNQASVLSWHGDDLDAKCLRFMMKEVKSGDTTGREAVAAACYFPALFGDGFTRQSEGPINALLNYGYSVLLSKISKYIVSMGYLTQIGINHRGKLNQWNLSCDFMEPFRPFIDYVILSEELEVLDSSSKHRIIGAFSNHFPYIDGEYQMDAIMKRYCRACIDALNGEKPSSEIESYELATL